ncbi:MULTISPECIES: carotenoid biosynthesis protein [Streptomyces]|uniref:Carotenoid biosynthesis protein n=1 Tax=Streptomyces reniochalinae TaxID=2250578 RepID=A0A367EBH2_9ACTN|nr:MULTISPECIES: carotenoid biosynthesis protein [Streptomyces]RCG15139.1 carotenoid biosynthesis protein [Streptomyces reniochalinae]
MLQSVQPPAPAPALGRHRRLTATVCGLAGIAIVCQILYPLATPSQRNSLTIVTVLFFCSASLLDASRCHGRRGAFTVLLVAAGGGLAVEVVGLRSGFPFGSYEYSDTLGPSLAGVPLVVPLAWAMMAWPALVVARVLTVRNRDRTPRRHNRLRTTLLGGWALASWDVFLDPQMVDAGHWRWHDPHPALPGVTGIPLSNFAGWLVVATLMMAALDTAVGRTARAPRAEVRFDGACSGPAVTLYLWTYASCVLAAAVFFGRPSVALVGGLLMGVTAVPMASVAWRSRSVLTVVSGRVGLAARCRGSARRHRWRRPRAARSAPTPPLRQPTGTTTSRQAPERGGGG